MNSWEVALNKFLEDWRDRKEVIGALVCGSYVTGKPSKHSDIDVHILLSNKVSWRERGNKIVNGFLIEYFANPSKRIPKYFEEDYNNNSKCSQTQFLTGRIIFDKMGAIKMLKKESKKWFNKKFKKPNIISTELQKYHLWDKLDNLEDKYEQNARDFSYVYHNFLSELIETYAKHICTSTLTIHKAHSFLTDHTTRKKYLANEFPDKKFVKMVTKALIENNQKKMMLHYKQLTAYVLKRMGKFNINGWKIRSSVK